MKQLTLFRPCAACEGHGRLAFNGVRIILCEACNGAGFVPSGDGRTIIALLKASGVDELMPDG